MENEDLMLQIWDAVVMTTNRHNAAYHYSNGIWVSEKIYHMMYYSSSEFKK